jgi:hypothetical protein
MSPSEQLQPQMPSPIITQIALKFGAGEGAPNAVINAAPLNIFLGPNNAGKSLLLSELDTFLRGPQGNHSATSKIIANLGYDAASAADAAKDAEKYRSEFHNQQRAHPDHTYLSKGNESVLVHSEQLKSYLNKPTVSDQYGVYSYFLRTNTIKLDGANRISLVSEKPLGDLQQNPKNRLAELFSNDVAREELRKVVFDAIGQYLVVDPTKPGQVRLRLSKRPPTSEQEEKGLHAEAVSFHSKALEINEASDGIKAFCGILLELFAGDPRVLIIDEPEAFLHPSLAFALGKAVATKARDSNKQIFASTHSVNFLMGCISAGTPVNVVRLTRNNDVSTARLLAPQNLVRLMRNPLLRSTGLLSGLFYEGVVVTEADPDRVFYAEINERILQKAPAEGARNCLFLNAQNKQTVNQLIRPLRELGIPAAGIVDIDVVKEGGEIWGKLALSVGLTPAMVHSTGTTRGNIKRYFDANGGNMKKGGVSLLHGAQRAEAEEFFELLRSYGLFVVSAGELEQWLPAQRIGDHGPGWLVPMLESMGENPADPAYLQPANNDVWLFSRQIAAWLAEPRRKGLTMYP